MSANPRESGKSRPISRAVVRFAFIVFLFYSNLLMGEFTQTNGQGKSLAFALKDIFLDHQFRNCHRCRTDWLRSF